jgi:hypothetical protein
VKTSVIMQVGRNLVDMFFSGTLRPKEADASMPPAHVGCRGHGVRMKRKC